MVNASLILKQRIMAKNQDIVVSEAFRVCKESVMGHMPHHEDKIHDALGIEQERYDELFDSSKTVIKAGMRGCHPVTQMLEGILHLCQTMPEVLIGVFTLGCAFTKYKEREKREREQFLQELIGDMPPFLQAKLVEAGLLPGQLLDSISHKDTKSFVIDASDPLVQEQMGEIFKRLNEIQRRQDQEE